MKAARRLTLQLAPEVGQASRLPSERDSASNSFESKSFVPTASARAGGTPALLWRNTHGFSLVEVMIAILILGIALVGLTQGITTALSSSKESEMQTTAALFAAGQIEQLRAEGGISDKETDGDCGTGLELYRWKQSISPTKTDGLHEVTVTIESTRDDKPVYELKTLLFERPEDSTDKKDSQKKGGRT